MSLRSTIVGGTMLVVLLTAGAAQSLSGSNTVYTDDIVDKNVTNVDLGTNSVTSSKVAPNSVTGSDVDENSLHPHLGFALVNSNGALVGGTPGTTSGYNSASHLYMVVFPFSVAGCAASAQVGLFAGFDAAATSTHPANYDIGRLEAHTVAVSWTDSGTTTVPTAFMLSLICP